MYHVSQKGLWILCLSILTCTQAFAQRPIFSLSIPYRAGKLWGYCDTLANVTLAPKYDSVGFFDINNGQYAIFKQKGKFGLLDKQYQEVLPASYEYLVFSDGPSPRNNIIVSINYEDDSKPTIHHCFATGNLGAVGVQAFDSAFKPEREIIPAMYDAVDFHYSNAHYILVSKAHKWGLYSDTGEKLCDPVFDDIFQSAGFSEVRVMHKRGMVGKKGSDYYLIVPQGEHILLKQKDYNPYRPNFVDWGDATTTILSKMEAGKAKHGFEEVLIERSDKLLENADVLVRKKDQIAIWNFSANILQTPYFEDFCDVQFPPMEAMEIMEEGMDDKAPSESDYSVLYYVKKGGKYGAIDQKNKERIPFIYDGFGSIGDFYAITKQKNKYGVIIKGTIYPTITPKYDRMDYAANLVVTRQWTFCLFKVTKNGKPGFVGENGKEYFVNK